MQKLFILFSLIFLSLASFSQKITITDFTPTQWTNAYENNNMQLFYKFADNSATSEKGRPFILFKINNKKSSELVLNINAVLEYNNVNQSFSNSKTFKIDPNGVLEGKTTGDGNIRVPFEKFREADKTLKSIKIDF